LFNISIEVLDTPREGSLALNIDGYDIPTYLLVGILGIKVDVPIGFDGILELKEIMNKLK